LDKALGFALLEDFFKKCNIPKGDITLYDNRPYNNSVSGSVGNDGQFSFWYISVEICDNLVTIGLSCRNSVPSEYFRSMKNVTIDLINPDSIHMICDTINHFIIEGERIDRMVNTDIKTGIQVTVAVFLVPSIIIIVIAVLMKVFG
jgi:hypothetical protein